MRLGMLKSRPDLDSEVPLDDVDPYKAPAIALPDVYTPQVCPSSKMASATETPVEAVPSQNPAAVVTAGAGVDDVDPLGKLSPPPPPHAVKTSTTKTTKNFFIATSRLR